MQIALTAHASALTRRPLHLPSAHNMNVQMVDTLCAILAIVDDETESFRTQFLALHLGDVNEMAQNGLLIFAHLGQLRETVAVFGNDEEVHGRLGIDVPEGQALIVFVDLVRGPFAGQELVEDGGRSGAIPVGCR